MSTWRDAVREELAVYHERTDHDVVRLARVYDVVLPRVRGQFPGNDNPRAKVRQILQQLRDRDEVDFLGDGRYDIGRIDRSSVDPAVLEGAEEDLEWDDPRLQTAEEVQQTLGATASSEPRRTRRVVDHLLRDESLVTTLKERYDSTCQLCGTHRLRDPETRYAECHHLTPLGTPHDGPDELPNMLVLCPDHHVDFDYGMVRVDPRSFAIDHAYDDGVHAELAVQHEVGRGHLTYHNDEIAVI